MKAVRRLLNLFRDSPSLGRDRANLFTGFTIGTASLILNGVILGLVTPLMMEPDAPDIRAFTQNLEFGQLLALILLGGAAAFATLLVPLRLVGVFWGPRIGRYFDQIVLSGVSPIRFVIGKVLSQSMFFALILFLLLPWLVLSVSIGGMEPIVCLGGLLLVWQYCIALTLVTLWLSLYFNELLAALMVIIGAGWMAGLGCIPVEFQPFTATPFPVLIHPVYKALPYTQDYVAPSVLPQYLACAVTMGAICCVALLAIHLGPLFGIIRENSTFGEVVRAGDSKRKRRLRLRLHIQRPSELAFFYENRGTAFVRHEGLLRWGVGLIPLLLLSGSATAILLIIIVTRNLVVTSEFSYVFLIGLMVIHGVGLLVAGLLFSHTKNSTFLRIAFCFGRRLEVSKPDTVCFLFFALISTTVAIATPFCVEELYAKPNALTVFPEYPYGQSGPAVDFQTAAIHGPLIILLVGLVVYSIHRFGCLKSWLKPVSFLAIVAAYYMAICIVPAGIGLFVDETNELRSIAVMSAVSQRISMVSPISPMLVLYNERFWADGLSRAEACSIFYGSHVTLLVVFIGMVRRSGRKLRGEYLASEKPEAT